MAIQNTTFRVYVEKLGASEATDFIGNEGDLFYDPNETELRLSDGATPGGILFSPFTMPPQVVSVPMVLLVQGIKLLSWESAVKARFHYQMRLFFQVHYRSNRNYHISQRW